jgi:hypothetical protein
MAKQLYKTIKGLTDAVLRTPDDRLLVLPTAVGGVFSPGQEVIAIEGNSKLGEMVVLDTYTTARKPEVKLDWNQANLTLIGVQLGLEFAEKFNVKTKVASNGVLITRSAYNPSGPGYEGNGMLADQEGSIASLLTENDLIVALTRQPFASFDPQVPMSFAQGADGAQLWSEDLIGKYVAYSFPHELSRAIKLTENSNSSFSLSMMTIMTDRTLLHWEFPSVSVKLEDGEINMAESKMALSFRVQDDGSDCLPYSVVSKGQIQRRKCV